MYSCCSGTCFLKPASTFSWLAKYSIASVTAANTMRISGRLPKTMFSAKRANGPGWALGRLIASPSLRAVQVGALVADHEESGVAGRQHAREQRRFAGGRLESGGRERRIGIGAHQHDAVGADQDGAAVVERVA